MKKLMKSLLIFSSISVFMIGLCYFGLALYYQNGFAFGTYINGIYCTGKSVNEVNDELNNSFVYEDLLIKTKDKTYRLRAKDMHYTFDFKEPLEQYLNEQNPYLWGMNMILNGKKYQLSPKGVYDKKYVDDFMNRNLFLNQAPEKVEIVFSDEGFCCNDFYKMQYDKESVSLAIHDALSKGKAEVILDDSCYKTGTYALKDQQLLDFYAKLDAFQNKKVVIRLGIESLHLSNKDLAGVLKVKSDIENGDYLKNVNNKGEFVFSKYTDRNDNLLVDAKALEDLLKTKLDPYNTYRNHTFFTHDGKEVYINSGNYGNQIKMKQLNRDINQFLLSDEKSVIIEPQYSKEALYKGKDDIGNTYIEVDVLEQKLYYFVDGKLFLESDVVTGNERYKNNTPTMVCYIYAKQKNRILRGPGYESFVYYWMPVSGGYGLHDATWRDEFGGEIYKTDGSHGCINLPLDVATTIYEKAEIGTPVIIY